MLKIIGTVEGRIESLHYLSTTENFEIKAIKIKRQ